MVYFITSDYGGYEFCNLKNGIAPYIYVYLLMCHPCMATTCKGIGSTYNVMKLTVLGMLESSKSFSKAISLYQCRLKSMCKAKGFYRLMLTILYGS